MSNAKPVEVALALWADRHLPISFFAEQAKTLAACDAVDGVLIADQLVNFIPKQLWKPEYTPIAGLLKDPDSHSDAFALGAYLAAVAPRLDIALSTDSVRRGASEVIQYLHTLANMTQGRVCLQIGGGEVKQTKPYGYNRAQGVNRLGDFLKVYRAMLEARGEPIDYEGRYWKFEKATLGAAMKRAEIWGLGGGPKLLDHVTTYGDGIGISCPPVYGTPAEYAKGRAEILRMVEEKGRDPSTFRFGIWFAVMMSDDAQQLAGLLENPLTKWLAGVMGRILPEDWKGVGLEPPVPPDWNYFQHFLPYETPDAFVEHVVAHTTPEHARKGWMVGSPRQVADQIQGFIDVGADWVCPMDYLPLLLPPEEAGPAFERSLELCRLIRERNPPRT
ncbi:MAG TPA: LLM class flavin-dependent oxidoreductase [Nevskiaceae bacterium]|nr:LLM class flavin-dependent oxidoreductase [Nevskiaceae bacterium]